MANLLDCMPKFTLPQIELIICAFAAYLDLPGEQIEREQIERSLPLRSRESLKDALIKAVNKNLLTFREANEIASIIGVSLYRR
jgi:hypothetical protein